MVSFFLHASWHSPNNKNRKKRIKEAQKRIIIIFLSLFLLSLAWLMFLINGNTLFMSLAPSFKCPLLIKTSTCLFLCLCRESPTSPAHMSIRVEFLFLMIHLIKYFFLLLFLLITCNFCTRTIPTNERMK